MKSINLLLLSLSFLALLSCQAVISNNTSPNKVKSKVKNKVKSKVNNTQTNSTDSSQATDEESATRSFPVKILIVTDNTYPPFMYEADGEVAGINVKLVEAVDLVLEDYDIEIQTMRWSDAIAKVRKGEATAILGPYFHAYSLSKIYPYSYPLVKETVVTVCHSDLAFGNDYPKWPDDYAGIKIGSVAGFAGWSPKAINLRDINTMNFFEFPNTKLALNGVAKGVVDCSIFEKNVFTFYRREAQKTNSDAFDNLRIVNTINHQTTHLGYSTAFLRDNQTPAIQAFSKQFDAALIQLKREGKLDHIYEKYDLIDY